MLSHDTSFKKEDSYGGKFYCNKIRDKGMMKKKVTEGIKGNERVFGKPVCPAQKISEKSIRFGLPSLGSFLLAGFNSVVIVDSLNS